MKNNRGQALVEFIIILPVLLLILLAIIDFGNIISKKYVLENDIDNITLLYENNKMEEVNKYLNSINATMSAHESSSFNKLTLKREIKIISPLVNVILGKKYVISASKSYYVGDISETE